jgi:hypothetical protein
MHEWAATHEGSSQRQSSGTAQKIAPAEAKMPGNLMGCGNGRFEWSRQFKSTFDSFGLDDALLAKALNYLRL